MLFRTSLFIYKQTVLLAYHGSILHLQPDNQLAILCSQLIKIMQSDGQQPCNNFPVLHAYRHAACNDLCDYSCLATVR